MINIQAYEQRTSRIISAAIEVHKELGFGFLETVYQHALEKELILRGIDFVAQGPIDVFYKGEKVSFYIPDFFIGDIIVELKALDVVPYEQVQGQIINYLAATRKPLALLLNFGKPKLEVKRYVMPEKIQRKISAISV